MEATTQAEALGRGRGGFGTKVHAVVEVPGNCRHLRLTSTQDADSPELPALLAALRQRPGAVACDKAYNTNSGLETIIGQEAEPVIPPITTRLDQRTYAQNLYADRNKIERFSGRLKEALGFATRYEKTASSFLTGTHLVAALDGMRYLFTDVSPMSKFTLLYEG